MKKLPDHKIECSKASSFSFLPIPIEQFEVILVFTVQLIILHQTIYQIRQQQLTYIMDSNIYWIILASVFFLLWATWRRNIFRPPVKRMWRRIEARLQDSFQMQYNERMCSRKEALIFIGLSKMTKDVGRPLHVLDIGSGPGANFAYLPDGTIVTCFDPVPEFGDYITKNAALFPRIQLGKFHVGFAEDMVAIESGSVDAVICTLVLCTVRNVDKCLQEVIRVLRPGGKFFFLEHVRAKKGTVIYYIQQLVNIPWCYLAHCNITRTVYENIQQAGFNKVEYDVFEADETVYPTPIIRFMSVLIKSHASGVGTK